MWIDQETKLVKKKNIIMLMDKSTGLSIKSPDHSQQTSKTNEILKLKVLKLKVLKLKVLKLKVLKLKGLKLKVSKLKVLKLKVTNIFVHF